MKPFITLVFALVLGSFCSSQTLDFKKADFTSIVYLNEIHFEFNFTEFIDSGEFQFRQNNSKNNMLHIDTNFQTQFRKAKHKIILELKVC